MKDRQQEDLDLWQTWKKENDPEALQDLLVRLKPVMHNEVQKWSQVVPTVALESKARGLVVRALDQYNPNKGAAIGTYVTGQLRKLSRYAYPYQNVARLPENKQLLYNTFNSAQNTLVEQLGRDPTTTELADELKWTPRKVQDFQRSFARKELVESEGSSAGEQESPSMLTDFYYHGLQPDNQKLFEDITGYGGVRPLSNNQLMSRHGLTQGQLSYRKRKFVADLTNIQQGKV